MTVFIVVVVIAVVVAVLRAMVGVVQSVGVVLFLVVDFVVWHAIYVHIHFGAVLCVIASARHVYYHGYAQRHRHGHLHTTTSGCILSCHLTRSVTSFYSFPSSGSSMSSFLTCTAA